MSVKSQALRDLVIERMVVAADEIFSLFEQTFAEYEQVLMSKFLQDHQYHMKHDPIEELQKDVQTVVMQTEVNPNLDCIKYEEVEVPLDLQFPPLAAKSEDDINDSIYFQKEPTEEHGQNALRKEYEDEEFHGEQYEGEEYHGEEYEGEEPGCSLVLDEEFAPCSYPDTDDSDNWEPTPKKKRKSRKRGNTLSCQNKRKHKNESSSNCTSNEKVQSQTNLLSQPFAGAKVKEFSCSLCHNSFSEKQYLNQHMRVHTGERPYRCEPCGMTFRFRQNYHQHNSTLHRKEKPHRCQVCNKEFDNKCELIAHKETHKDEEPYKCLNCNKTFMCISSLMSHKMSQKCI